MRRIGIYCGISVSVREDARSALVAAIAALIAPTISGARQHDPRQAREIHFPAQA
jgi:hypothetical protein